MRLWGGFIRCGGGGMRRYGLCKMGGVAFEERGGVWSSDLVGMRTRWT